MKLKITLLTLTILLLGISCSTDDENDRLKEFRFLEFEKDVLLPSMGTREISLFGIDFDKDVNRYEVKVISDIGETFDTSITEIIDTPFGFTGNQIRQDIKINLPVLQEGNYRLNLTYIPTGQSIEEKFLIRSGIFRDISQEYEFSYAMLTDDQNATPDNYYFQDIINTINDASINSSVAQVILEQKSTMNKISLDYQVNMNSGSIDFIIPQTVAPGKYYVSVIYDNLLTSYFDKDILVLAKQTPVVISLDKNVYSAGETITIAGSKLRYTLDASNINDFDLRQSLINTALLFRYDASNVEETISPYSSDPTYNYINTSETEIKFPIPLEFIYSDNTLTYYEGEVAVRIGPYVSEYFPIRIEY